MKVLVILCLLLIPCTCVIYINHIKSDFNPKLLNFTISYANQSNGGSITNATFQTLVNITKMLVYVTMKTPENKNDREYRHEIFRSVVDVDKVFKGSQSNPVIRSFAGSILKSADFEVNLPLRPVSIEISTFEPQLTRQLFQGTYKFINVVMDSTFIPLPQDSVGMVSARLVIKVPNNPKLQFFLGISFYGGFKRTK